MKQINNQKGFTLVEIAIVLVIIGLLLGGVLKGQELIENSKAKNAIKDLDGVISAYNAYQDRYKRIPGDDGTLAVLQARGGGSWTSITVAGGLNSVLTNAPAATFTGAGEGLGFWQHLRAAGFVSGNPNTAGVAALPRNAFGGLIGVTNIGVTGQSGFSAYVCMSQVPGKAAAAIDNQLDDGLPNNGSVMATTGVVGANTAPGAAAAAPYVETAVYTICRGM